MKKFLAAFLSLLLIATMLPLGAVSVSAATTITNPNGADGAAYSVKYADKLNDIFQGKVALFNGSSDKYALGDSLDINKKYYVSTAISGYQCYIYAQGVYYYLFGDIPYHGEGIGNYWKNSKQVLSNQPSASYSAFVNAEVGFGAYLRTTSNSDGSYHTSNGHSVIILTYDETSITYLDANGDNKGLVRINVRTWAEFNSYHSLSSGQRKISHICQPKDAVAPTLIPDGLVKEEYRTHCEVTVSKDCTIKSLPCSPTTNAGSKEIESAKQGDAYEAVAMYRNTATSNGNLWYQVKTKNGRIGYLFAGNTDPNSVKQLTTDVTIDSPVIPSTILQGNDFVIGGTVKTQYQTLIEVGAWVADATGSFAIGEMENTNAPTYSLKGSIVDTTVDFSALSAGQYYYSVWAMVKMYYASNETTVSYRAVTIDVLLDKKFSVIKEVPPSGVYATIDTGNYFLTNKGTGRYLCVSEGKDVNKQNVAAGISDGSVAQTFEITPSTTTAGYKLRPLCSSSRMVNVYGDTVSSGANVCLWDDTGHDSQRWNFEAVNGGYVIRNVQVPSCVLTVQSDNNVCVQTYTGADSQIWTLESVENSRPAYDANAAVAYAAAHWNDGVGKCATFVSNCLAAGGCNAWSSLVSDLRNQLINSNWGTEYVLTKSGSAIYQSANAGKLSAGDPIFYYCTRCQGWMHTVFCSGFDSAGKATAYAHNVAWNNVNYLGAFEDASGHTGSDIIAYSFHIDATSVPVNPSAKLPDPICKPVREETFMLKNAAYPSMFLNVYAGKDANATKVVAWEIDLATKDQQFSMIHLGDGSYYLQAAGLTNRVLDIYWGSNNVVDYGDTLQVWTKGEYDETTIFNVVPVGANKYAIELKSLDNAVLTMTSGQNNSTVTLQNYTGSDAQHWYFCDLTGTIADPSAGDNHAWDNGVETTAATCSSTGVMTYTCTACGLVDLHVIPVADHTYDNDCDTDCNECGEVRDVAGHVYDNDCDTDCNECGAVREVEHNFRVVEVEATCSEYGKRCYTCEVCGYYFEEVIADDVSDWSEEYPSGVEAELIESKIEYRYREWIETTEPITEDGWILDSTYTRMGEYGAWSNWTASAITGSDNTQVESRTAYRYYYYKCPNCGAHMHVYLGCYTWAGGCGKSGINSGHYVQIDSTVPYSSVGLQEFHGTGRYYTYLDGQLVFQHRDGSQTQYRSRTREEETVYKYYRYTDWSDWSEECNDPNAMVEERTVYRYVIPGLADHTYDDEYDADCNECGAVREVPEKPVEIVSGDANGDGFVNNLDVATLQRYLNSWGVDVDTIAADVDADGFVNNLDLAILQRYINGWDVTLG